MLSDHPITTVKNDLLGRAGFSRQVASAMLACPADKRGSVVIGLCGGLGSGKTSVCNMVAEALANAKGKKVAGKPPKPEPIVIRFNPWRYPAVELAPGQFLRILAAELRQPKHGEKLHKAAKAILQYAAVLQRDGQPQDVPERKARVCKRLRKQKRKIYIIIDDIDYLPAPRIRDMLRLVDAVADFPRMVYLLSFDQQVVANALDTGGTEALKRFVQAQFTIPAPSTGRIREILTLYLDTWRQSRPDLNVDSAYLDAVTPFLFACTNSLRDVYRFANTFRFRYQALGDEVNFADLLIVAAMQLYAPKALPWMQAHRNDLLRGGGLAVRDASASCKQRMKREHQQMIAGLCGTSDSLLEPTIARLFPRYGREVLGYEEDEPGEHAVRTRRICCEEYFPLYFSLSADGLVITHKELLQSVRVKDVAVLRQYTNGLTEDKHRNAYINQLPYYLEDIPQEMLPVFFAETLWLSRLPEEASPAAERYQRSYFQACCYCALRMLARMDKTMQKQSLQQAAARADVHTLPLLAVVLGRIRDHSPDAYAVPCSEGSDGPVPGTGSASDPCLCRWRQLADAAASPACAGVLETGGCRDLCAVFRCPQTGRLQSGAADLRRDAAL